MKLKSFLSKKVVKKTSIHPSHTPNAHNHHSTMDAAALLRWLSSDW